MSFRYNKFKIMASPGSPFFACYQIIPPVPISEAVAHLVYSGEPCEILVRVRDRVRERLFSSSLQAPRYHNTDPSHPMSFFHYLNTNM